MATEATKPQYRIRNWSADDAALKQCGSLTFWIDEEVLKGWLNTEKTGKRGAAWTFMAKPIANFRKLNCG